MVHKKIYSTVGYQILGTGKYNEIYIGKNASGWYVTIVNPMNSGSWMFKTRSQAMNYADKRAMEMMRKFRKSGENPKLAVR